MTIVTIYPHHKDYTVLMFPVIQHLSEVCSLSCRANLEPVSVSLQNGIRFFRPPLPTYLSALLAGCFPYLNGSNWAYPVPPIFTRWVSVCLSAGGIIDRVRQNQTASSIPLTFWFRPSSIFGLLSITTFISSSHMLRIPSFLAPIRPDAARVEFASRLTLPISD